VRADRGSHVPLQGATGDIPEPYHFRERAYHLSRAQQFDN
jgi:hypothetical protein